MQGKVLDFDPRTGSGVIRGEDGTRYPFQGTNVERDFSRIRPGCSVDFEIRGRDAVSIFPLNAGPGPGQPGSKSKLAAGLLAIFLGGLGIHKFYLGFNKPAVIMLCCALFGWILFLIPNAVVSVIALVEGIIYLTKTDDEFYELYEVQKKEWF